MDVEDYGWFLVEAAAQNSDSQQFVDPGDVPAEHRTSNSSRDAKPIRRPGCRGSRFSNERSCRASKP